MRERDIFIDALEQSDSIARQAVVDTACEHDVELRYRIEKLLSEHECQQKFILDEPPGELIDPVWAKGGSPTIAFPCKERPGTVIGPYKLLQLIGEGGMGIVYLAEQSAPIHRTVALKIIKHGLNSHDMVARFEAERQALAVMDHANIAHVLDAGSTDAGAPYFVMELVKGVPITEYCDQHHLTIRERLVLMVPVCQAVQHAHQKGIIHRDIKPTNVLVAEYDDVPIPKVIDFGVAKATAQRLTEKTFCTQFGQLIGTFEYMSPEQARLNQLDVDTRTDVYSLGVLLYELLTGSTPLEKERLRAAALDVILRLINNEEPPRPSARVSSSREVPFVAANRSQEPKSLTRQLRGELDWIVMKCLEKDRNHRYETANGLALDLKRHLSDEPVRACSPSSMYRMKKFVRRNTATVFAGAAVAAALLLGAGVSTWLYLRERDARQVAELAAVRETQARLVQDADNLISQAKFLIRNREPELAEARIEQLGPAIQQLGPVDAATVYSKLGGLRGGQALWREASANYAKAIERDPAEYEHYHWCMPALVQGSELAGYRQLRQRVISKFHKTANPLIAERALKDCLILPWDDANFEILNGMGKTTATAGTEHWAWGYMLFVQGLLEYREGHFAEAVPHLRGALTRPTEDTNRTVQAYMVLAMAEYQLQHPEQARKTLTMGLNYAAEKLPPEETLLDYVGWNDWLIAHALMREARTLIEGSESVKPLPWD